MNYRMIELFCGPGGIALGAKQAKVTDNNESTGIVSVWANDYDYDTCKTYEKNLKKYEKNLEVVCGDIREINLNNIPNFEGLSFGFPCNDFSIVGEQKGINGNYGPLYSYGVKILNKYKPMWFVAENVGGLKNANDGQTFKQILSEVKSAGNGYTITSHLYKFEDYGVPQSRHRIIIVGIRNDLKKKFKVPAPTVIKFKTCKDAIENPPIQKDAPNNELTNQSKTVVERLKHIKPGENAFNAKIPEHLRLNVKGAKLSHIYKRLNPELPAYTLTGSGGGGTHVYHWKENRALTNRERARLQTFPDTFVFTGGKESVRKQIGMAVPPKGVEVVFKGLLKTLASIPYTSVEENLPFKK